MQVHYGFDLSIPITRAVVTLGSYDGVHRGHREILSHICDVAHRRQGESVVITFHPHPRIVLGKADGMKLLNTLSEKLALLAQVGIDRVIVAPFTEAFSRLSPETFVKEYLVERLCLDTLMVGYDHHFGHAQQGNPQLLETLSRQLHFRLEEIPQQSLHGEKISSTAVRHLIQQGNMSEAAHYLGAPYPLTGRVSCSGQLTEIDAWKLLPPEGIYTVTVHPSTQLHDQISSLAPLQQPIEDSAWNRMQISSGKELTLLDPVPFLNEPSAKVALQFV